MMGILHHSKNYAAFLYNTPDIFLNGFKRLSGLMASGLSYFFKVSSTSDFEKKIKPTAESGFEV